MLNMSCILGISLIWSQCSQIQFSNIFLNIFISVSLRNTGLQFSFLTVCLADFAIQDNPGLKESNGNAPYSAVYQKKNMQDCYYFFIKRSMEFSSKNIWAYFRRFLTTIKYFVNFFNLKFLLDELLSVIQGMHLF